jgi:hypothetical protein
MTTLRGSVALVGDADSRLRRLRQLSPSRAVTPDALNGGLVQAQLFATAARDGVMGARHVGRRP